MSTLVNKGSAIHTQYLLSKAIVKNKVSTSDLMKCLKSVRNLPAEKDFSINRDHLDKLGDILTGQNSKVYNKKKEILDMIRGLFSPDKETLTDSSTTKKSTFFVDCSKDNSVDYIEDISQADYDSVYSEPGNISLTSRHGSFRSNSRCSHSEDSEAMMQEAFNSELKSALEKRQQSKTYIINDILIKNKEKEPGAENRRTSTEFEEVYSRVLKKSAQAQNQSIPERSDDIPECATEQKPNSTYTPKEIQEYLEESIYLLEKDLEHCNTENETHAYSDLISIGKDMYKIMGRLGDEKPLSSEESMRAQRITNECLRKIHSIDVADMPKTLAAKAIEKITTMTHCYFKA